MSGDGEHQGAFSTLGCFGYFRGLHPSRANRFPLSAPRLSINPISSSARILQDLNSPARRASGRLKERPVVGKAGRPGRGTPNSVGFGEGKRECWVSHVQDRHPKPNTREMTTKRRLETFAWHIPLAFTVCRTGTRYSGDILKVRMRNVAWWGVGDPANWIDGNQFVSVQDLIRPRGIHLQIFNQPEEASSKW